MISDEYNPADHEGIVRRNQSCEEIKYEGVSGHDALNFPSPTLST